MARQKNYPNYDEIDLSKIILSIWDNKLKIFTITVVTILAVYVSQIKQEPDKLVYNTNTEIRPISTFDEVKYAFYNSYLKKINEGNFYRDEKKTKVLLLRDIYTPNFSSFLLINRTFLNNLFIDKLNENSTYIDAIKKFNLIKKENYSDNSKYEGAVLKLASSIKLIPPNDNKIYWSIELQTNNLENIVNFLKFVEKKTNQEIQLYLENTLKNQIISEKKLKKYEIEDIDIKILNKKENFKTIIELILNPIEKDFYINNYITEINNLEIRKKILLANKDVERFEDILNDTPIINTGKFYAANLMVESMEYRKLNKVEYSMLKKLFLAGVLGLILGMIFIFLSNIINQKR